MSKPIKRLLDAKHMRTPKETKSLPLNYWVNDGTIIEDFTSLIGWEKIGANTEMQLEEGIKLVSSDPYPEIIKGGYSNQFVNKSLIALSVDIPDVSKLKYLAIYLSSVRDFSKHYSKTINIDRTCRNGVNLLAYNNADFTNTNEDVWDNIAYIRLKPFFTGAAEITFKRLYIQPVITSLLVMNFDDADSSIYDKAFPILQNAGIAGTFYLIPSRVGRPGYVTLAQLEEMYDSGWDIANHTYNHARLTDLSDAEIITEVSECSEWLVNNGFTRAAYHLSYPRSGRSQHITDIIKDLGILTARSSFAGIQYNPNNLYDMSRSFTLDLNADIDSLKNAVDSLVKNGGTDFIYGHIIKDAPVTEEYTIATNVFQEFVNYVVLKGVKTTTISKWYRGLTQPCKLVE